MILISAQNVDPETYPSVISHTIMGNSIHELNVQHPIIAKLNEIYSEMYKRQKKINKIHPQND